MGRGARAEPNPWVATGGARARRLRRAVVRAAQVRAGELWRGKTDARRCAARQGRAKRQARRRDRRRRQCRLVWRSSRRAPRDATSARRRYHGGAALGAPRSVDGAALPSRSRAPVVADRAPHCQRPPAQQQQEQQQQDERQEREQEREQEDAQSKTYYWAPPAADQQSSTEVVHLREMRHGGGQAGARGGRSRPGPRATRDLAARPPGTSPPVTCLRAADSWISQSSSTADADGAGAPDGNAAGGGTSRIRGVSSDDRFGGHRACHRGSDTPRRLTNLRNV